MLELGVDELGALELLVGLLELDEGFEDDEEGLLDDDESLELGLLELELLGTSQQHGNQAIIRLHIRLE